MVAATPILPELSPGESELLAHFLILRYDMVALAEARKLLPQQLLAFAQSPAVNAHLAALKTFAEQAFSLRSIESRTKSLDILERVATTSDDPIEQRRAASTILRGLGLQRLRSGSPSLREGVGGRAHEAHEIQQRSTITDRPSIPPLSPPPHPPISPTPSPSLTPDQVLSYLDRALAYHTHPKSQATIQAFLAEDATIDAAPVTSLQDSLNKLTSKGDHVTTYAAFIPRLNPGPPETFQARAWLTHDDGRQTTIEIHLTRATSGPHTGAWLISSLANIPDSS